MDRAHETAIKAALANDWDKAHQIVQVMNDPLACWIHAILHKIEGDASNGRYWYGRSGGRQYEDFSDPPAELQAALFSSGGFDSLTVKHSLAREFADMGGVRVLHIGDHDPSGVHVFGSLDEDVGAFVAELGGEVEFVRLAVTPEHIEQYDLPTAPPKATDRRNFQGETVQAEALPPDTLAAILDDAILENLDMEIYRLAVEREARERMELLAWLGER